ncbi:MAG TPA: hypothetical protein VMP01_04325 [Pirellulaceae bacterium]|nr:hypothetical protein [Pirellulaceae bacterium]
MSLIQWSALLLVMLDMTLSHYVFRFQRTTLFLARKCAPQEVTNAQLLMTPIWMGVLGWLHTALALGTIVLVYFAFGWLWTGAWILYLLILSAVVDRLCPIPPYEHCLTLIEGELTRPKSRSVIERVQLLGGAGILFDKWALQEIQRLRDVGIPVGGL